jgi:hypothetical protein
MPATLGDFAILDTFGTQSQLDAAYGNGNYNLTVDTTAGVFSRSIFLSPLSYRVTPPLTVPAGNWQNGSLIVNSAQDYTFTWEPFSNAQPADFIQLIIHNSNVNIAPFPATQTSYTLPAGALQANRSYISDLVFVRVAGSAPGDSVIGPGSATLASETGFLIRTPPQPLVLTAAASRKNHGFDAAFHDIPLPLSGSPGVECRIGGSEGAQELVFTFNNVVVSGTATIISGAGRIAFGPSFTAIRCASVSGALRTHR